MTGVAAETWNRRRAAWIARGSFAFIAVWIASAMLAARAGLPRVSAAFELPLSLVCHRLPERVMSIDGTPMPLCSRCAGIWLGISIGAAVGWPALPLRTVRVVVLAALALLLIDVALTPYHPVWHSTRLGTGLLLGLSMGTAIGAFIARELGAPAQLLPDAAIAKPNAK